jgi:3-hydroxyisobutyrate dehydrogenase-like beta-hydroxyacid dehydrogenase
MKVGFIGLGAMGGPMAMRVAHAGHQLFCVGGHGAADALSALGACIMATPADVARAADVVITILPADAQLKDVVLGANGLREGLTAGKTLIDMTTATGMSLLEIERQLAPLGVRVLDAPVSGGTPAAAEGTLTIMVGGDADLLEQHRPLLETMGARIVHVGALGQGKVVKMVNQMMAAVHLLAIGEAFALGSRCGADATTMYNVIRESSGYSRMMDLRLPGFLLAGSCRPGFKLDLMKKDLNLALESARSTGAPVLLTSLAVQVFAAASTAGKGGADFSAAAQFLAAMANVDLSRNDFTETSSQSAGVTTS